jgi:phosphoribosylaminoimidazole carboxylase PurE protein
MSDISSSQLPSNKPLVAILIGSGSDWKAIKPAALILREFGIPFDARIKSAHRTPLKMVEYAINARKNGILVIIAAAGGAAHLPGMVAALTSLPIIGVPVALAEPIDNQAATLSIGQMPNSVPVGAMGIGRARNAGLYALRILSLAFPFLLDRLEKYSDATANDVIMEDQKLAADWENYTYTPKP